MRGTVIGADGVARCSWCAGDPLYESYHDTEWGRPVKDDTRLFEKLSLEGFQSGLSWLTILRKRENFRRAFKSFDIDAVARFNTRSVQRLMSDAGIVRNRAKIEATISNARRCSELIGEFGSLAAYVWGFEPDPMTRPRTLTSEALMQNTTSAESLAMSKDMRRRGWAFVGGNHRLRVHGSDGPGERPSHRVRRARRRRARPHPVPKAYCVILIFVVNLAIAAES